MILYNTFNNIFSSVNMYIHSYVKSTYTIEPIYIYYNRVPICM